MDAYQIHPQTLGRVMRAFQSLSALTQGRMVKACQRCVFWWGVEILCKKSEFFLSTSIILTTSYWPSDRERSEGGGFAMRCGTQLGEFVCFRRIFVVNIFVKWHEAAKGSAESCLKTGKLKFGKHIFSLQHIPSHYWTFSSQKPARMTSQLHIASRVEATIEAYNSVRDFANREEWKGKFNGEKVSLHLHVISITLHLK